MPTLMPRDRGCKLTGSHLQSRQMTAGQLHMLPAAKRRRAVLPEDKSERRAAIVRAAQDLLGRAPMGAFSVEALARRAGLAKGTVYLYFGTREEVLLAVHGEHARRLFDAVGAVLESERAGADGVVRATLRFLRANPGFLPLAATCRGMLENNVGEQAAIEFKLGLATRLGELGARIERLYPGLARGAGVALLTNSYALMIGLWQLADPPACLREALKRRDLRVFRIDFEKQLAAALLGLWEGAVRRSEGASR
jgi:AcrR family transcriptional regulator